MEGSHKSHYKQYTADALVKERFKLRNRIDKTMDIPFAVLGLIWLNLLIVLMIYEDNMLWQGATGIWLLFQTELLIKVYLSPSAMLYFRKNPLKVASSMIPALRILIFLEYIPHSARRRKYPSKLKQL
jgi:hypothetical protein